MSQQETTGMLADGGSYRATSYMVETLDASGQVTNTIDLGEIQEIRRAGLNVTFKPRKGAGKEITLQGATIADAGRLEAATKPAGAVTPPAPAKSGGGFGRVMKWGCLGTIALVVVIVIIIAVTASGGDSSSDNTEANSSTSVSAGAGGGQGAATKEVGTNKGDVHVALTEGQSGEIKVGDDHVHKVTILKITDAAQSTNEFEKPAEGKKYWVVQVQVENAGPAEIYVGSWKLRTSDDFEQDPTFAVGLGEALPLSQNLTSGAKVQGNIVFEVAADAQPKFLRYDPNVLLKGDLYFDAQ